MKLFKSKPFLLLLPGFLFLLLPLYGLLAAMHQSFQQNGVWTFYYYQQLLNSDRFLSSVGFSLKIALISTLFSLVIGLFITRTFVSLLEKHTPRLMVWLPMLFPHFVWGYMVILLLAETGVIAQILVVSGGLENSSHFPILTRDPYGIGIILTYVWKEIPFVILMLLPVYASIPSHYFDLVKTLGGGQWRQFISVEWPHLLPVLYETFLIIFSFTLAAYEVPALLGTTYPEMISVLSYEWFYDGNWQDRSMAFAAMVSLSSFLLLFTLTGYLLLNTKRRKAMRGRV